MDQEIKNGLQSVIFAILYILLFLILVPPLMQVLDERWGKILYGLLVAGAVIVAFRLRFLFRSLSRN